MKSDRLKLRTPAGLESAVAAPHLFLPVATFLQKEDVEVMT